MCEFLFFFFFEGAFFFRPGKCICSFQTWPLCFLFCGFPVSVCFSPLWLSSSVSPVFDYPCVCLLCVSPPCVCWCLSSHQVLQCFLVQDFLWNFVFLVLYCWITVFFQFANLLGFSFIKTFLSSLCSWVPCSCVSAALWPHIVTVTWFLKGIEQETVRKKQGAVWGEKKKNFWSSWGARLKDHIRSPCA